MAVAVRVLAATPLFALLVLPLEAGGADLGTGLVLGVVPLLARIRTLLDAGLRLLAQGAGARGLALSRAGSQPGTGPQPRAQDGGGVPRGATMRSDHPAGSLSVLAGGHAAQRGFMPL